MIENTNAIELFEINIQRTEMLIEAIDKIRAYNRLYQMEQTDQEYLRLVKQVQEDQFEHIQRSCGEHAIISLATAFETYYKEFLQQLLFQFPNYFTSKKIKHSNTLTEIIDSEHLVNYEIIEEKLKLRNRFDYYDFFKAYNVEFLSATDKEFIKYIYVQRNNFVHNAGKTDTKTKKKLKNTPKPYNEQMISTEAKRLRTNFKKIIYKSHHKIILRLKSEKV